MQRFVDDGNVDSDNYGASLGYNYQINKTDTIGVVYRFNRFTYPGQGETLNDNVVNLAYGKKITGRLALQIFGGPDITTIDFGGGVLGAPASSTRNVTGAGGGNLTYGLEHGTLGLTYNHGVTAGSGVFAGSETDSIWREYFASIWARVARTSECGICEKSRADQRVGGDSGIAEHLRFRVCGSGIRARAGA